MRTEQVIGLVGATIIAIGAFAPIMRMPIMGGVSLMQGEGGYILLAAAVLSLLGALSNRLKPLWLTGTVALGVVLRVVYDLHTTKAEMTASVEEEGDNPFASLASLAVQSVQLDWGCPVLFVGACLLLVAAGWKREVAV